jgi:hypothetical protein
MWHVGQRTQRKAASHPPDAGTPNVGDTGSKQVQALEACQLGNALHASICSTANPSARSGAGHCVGAAASNGSGSIRWV